LRPGLADGPDFACAFCLRSATKRSSWPTALTGGLILSGPSQWTGGHGKRAKSRRISHRVLFSRRALRRVPSPSIPIEVIITSPGAIGRSRTLSGEVPRHQFEPTPSGSAGHASSWVGLKTDGRSWLYSRVVGISTRRRKLTSWRDFCSAWTCFGHPVVLSGDSEVADHGGPRESRTPRGSSMTDASPQIGGPMCARVRASPCTTAPDAPFRARPGAGRAPPGESVRNRRRSNFPAVEILTRRRVLDTPTRPGRAN
jgi:hypothetical protein